MLSERVYQTLRSEIVHGDLWPNQPMVEAEIAERLQVSRTPVRESMQRLASDGLIVSRRRRWVVYEHTQDEIRDIYEVRAALESHTARLAAQRADEADRDALSTVSGESSHLRFLGGRARIDANEAFHDLVVRAAHNKRLGEEIVRTRLYSFNTRIVAAYDRDLLARSWGDHEQIAAAVLEGDADRAAELARAHVEDAMAIILDRS
ncbi:GntR family transcriptional regulator [Ornithinimicrobium kibberense]|uniref:GntR family transcriptional regulator n=1 Tax=Ornithinimicrobium kibberense TaxID=282060 RepID=A0ABV5V5W5_9MICO|nr:GntR family transcriptional regulator [Ornithinimicrobium kibberense]